MLKLFVIDNGILRDESAFNSAMRLIGDDRKQRLNSLTADIRRRQCVAAGAILPLALQNCGYTSCPQIAFNGYGKPQLQSPAGLHFNVSHSNGYTVAALSDSEVGCDIQFIKPVNTDVAKRYFCPDEYADIISSPNPKQKFFYYWVAKESFLKAIGTGLARPMNTFKVVFDGVGAVIEEAAVGGARSAWRVSFYTGFKNYIVAVCHKEGETLPPPQTLGL